MKRRAFLGASAAASLGLVSTRQVQAAQSEYQHGNGNKMRAGFARVKITPAVGTTMMGFGTRDVTGGCKAIRDDIYARALFLEQGSQQVLIIGFDLCLMDRVLTDRIKGAIARQVDLSGQKILLSTSHNHVAPSTGTWYSAGYYENKDQLYLNRLDRDYRNLLVKATVQAARQAHDAMREVALWTGVTKTALPISRRKPDGKGGILWAPNSEGITYDRLPICLLKDNADTPVCLLFSVSAHPSIVSGWQISAEYPGVAMNLLDMRLGTKCSLFLQGVAGDANASVGVKNDKWYRGKWPEMEKAGQMVAQAVIKAIDHGLTQIEPELRSAYIETLWPLEPLPTQEEFKEMATVPDPKKLGVRNRVRWQWAKKHLRLLKQGKTLPTTAPIASQGIKLAKDVRLFALEGEPVAEWGHIIEKFYGDGTTFPIGYSNGQGLYLPVSHMLPHGGYCVDSYWEYGFPAKLAPGMEKIVQKTLKQMKEQGIG